MEMKQEFKSSDILISRIKENLSSYDSAGVVDTGKFYFYIKEELRLLGEYVYITKEDLLPVENKKTALPKDFIQLYALYNVNANSKKVVLDGYLPDKTYTKFLQDCQENTIVVREKTIVIDRDVVIKNEGALLKYSGKVDTDLCFKDSPNYGVKSENEFNIDRNYIYLNIDKGDVYLQYLAFPYDEEGYPMIPDEVKIEKAIEYYIMYKTFEYFYLNDIINSALQKMQYFQQLYNLAHREALLYVKLPTFESLKELAYTNVNNRFKIFELKRNGKYPYHTPSRDAKR